MRYLLMLLVSIFFASCGKESTSKSSQGPAECFQNSEDQKCWAIQTTDGAEVDLLDSFIDVPARVTDSEIVFLATKISRSEGRRINCDTEVKNGEVYQFVLDNENLHLKTGAKSFTMARLNEDGNGIYGAWIWKGQEDRGVYIIKTMTVISRNRILLKTHCEF